MTCSRENDVYVTWSDRAGNMIEAGQNQKLAQCVVMAAATRQDEIDGGS